MPEKLKKVTEIGQLLLDLPKSSLQEFEILPDFFSVNKRIVDLNFPKSAFIVMIKRDKEYIRLGGTTEIKANDTLMVLANTVKDYEKVNECLYKTDNAKKL